LRVREGAWVGWKEETKRKRMECDLKEGSDGNHVAFMSETTLPLLCVCAVTFLCLSGNYAKTKACYVQIVIEMCG
jgi:hypothetical protein